MNAAEEAPDAKTKFSVISKLDEFLKGFGIDMAKDEMLLRYVQSLSGGVNNSQLLQAELAYLFFKSDKCIT